MGNTKNKSDNKKLHTGHRQRVKNKFIEAGNLDGFTDHEILEMLLFYGVPMKDTNEMAHRLLNNYGSLHNLFNAGIEDLIQSCKVTENVAVLLTMMPHIYRRYMKSKFDYENVKLDNANASGDYFISLLQGKAIEELYMVCLNAKKQIIRTVMISSGTANNTNINLNKIIENAVLAKCAYVIIGHNHPADSPSPSRADFNATSTIRDALKVIDVVLMDHIIVCGENYTSLAARGNCHMKY